MRSKRAAIIFGGLLLSSFPLLLLIQIVLAAEAPPIPTQRFQGNVTVGGLPAQDGLEIGVKVKEAGAFLPLTLTSLSLDQDGRHLTKGGTYGDFQVFVVPADDSDTPEREGAKPGEPLFFFVADIQARMFDADGAEISTGEGIPFKSGFDEINLEIDALGLSAPILLLPASGDLVNTQTPFFDWQIPETADPVSYQLLVTSGDIDTGPYDINVVITGDPPNTEFQVQTGNELAEDSYLWRVIATDIIPQTAPSETRSFTIDATAPPAPALITPASGDQIFDSTPEFQWTSVIDPPFSGDLSYTLQIGSGDFGDFAVPVREITGITGTGAVISFTLPQGIKLQPGKYSWHVQAVDAAGNTGDFSSFNAFEIFAAVDLSLEPLPQVVPPGAIVTVTIKVDPQGQEVSVIDAFLDFSTGDLKALSIAAGVTLEVVGTADFDNANGHIDYSAFTLTTPPTQPFVLAVVTFEAQTPSAPRVDSIIAFSTTGSRTTNAEFSAESVLGNTFGTTVVILKRTVDLRLGLQASDIKFEDFGSFAFARDAEFDVIVRVEPNGQEISAVDALLDFDVSTLRVLAVTASGDGRIDQQLISAFDNQLGTIDFSATITGGTGDFNLVAVTFQTVKATQSLGVGFHREFPRKTDVALAVFVEEEGVLDPPLSVLRDLFGFPLEIALQLRLTSFNSFQAEVFIQVRPNGNRVSTVDAFLDFDTGDMTLANPVSAAGTAMELVLTGDSDNENGTVNYAALTLGGPPISEFDLAVVGASFTGDLAGLAGMQILFHCFDGTGDLIADEDCTPPFPRNTQGAFEGASVPVRLVPLTTLTPFPPGVLENLKKTMPSNDNTPTFQWDPPLIRPVAGINSFVVSITGTGDNPGPSVVAGDVNDVNPPQCFGADGSVVDCFVQAGEFNFDDVTYVEFTVPQVLADGRYRFSVAAVDNLSQTGDETEIPLFSIDTGTPTVPVVSGNLGVDLAFTNDPQPLLEWETSTDGLTATSDLTYDVQVALTQSFLGPETREITTGDLFWKVGQLATDTIYWWRVRAVDDAGIIPADPGESDQGPLQSEPEVLPGRGNSSEFSTPIRFVIDTVPPSDPQSLENLSTGGDTTPTFRWIRSTDAGFISPGDLANTGSGVAFYDVVITGDSIVVLTGQVPDGACDPLTNLCTFSGDLAGNAAYSIGVSAVDGATNRSAPVTADFIVDTLAPSLPGVPFLALQTSGDVGIDAQFGWVRSTDEGFPNTGSGVDFYDVEINPGNITGTVDDSTCTTNGNECRFTGDELADGTYTVQAIAVDVATNRSAPSTLVNQFVGDPSKPQNLVQTGDAFIATPSFTWTGPDIGDVTTYVVVITGDTLPAPITGNFQDPRFFSSVTCNGAPCGVIGSGDVIELTVVGTDLPGGLPDGNHIFGVAVDLAGIVGEETSIPFQVDTTSPLPPSNLSLDAIQLNPLVKADNRTPQFTWVASTGDTGDGVLGSGFSHYELTIDDIGLPDTADGVFFSEVGLQTRDTTFTLAPEDSLPDDEYRASVIAVDVAGNQSAPATVDFFVDLLAPTAPTNLTKTSLDSDRSPEIDWDASTDAGLGVDKYRVRIESVALVDTTAPAAPVLIAPADNGFLNSGSLSFSWNQVSDETAVTYTIEIGTGAQPTTGAFTSNVVFTADVADSPGTIQFSLPISLSTADTHSWHVQANDDGRNASPFSEVRTFDVLVDNELPSDPVSISPVGPTADFTPTFTWIASVDPPDTGDVSYVLEIALVVDVFFDNPTFIADGITGTQFTLPGANALASGDYFWHLKAVDRVGNEGSFSSLATFAITDAIPPLKPVLVFPLNDSTGGNTTPSFRWIQVADDSGVTYRIEIATGSQPTTGAFTSNLVLTADVADVLVVRNGQPVIEFTVPTPLSTTDTHTWHVRAEDGAGNTGDFSTNFSFNIGVDTTAPAVPTLISPAEASTSDDPTLTFQWSRVDDPSDVSYELQVSTTGDFSSLVVNTGDIIDTSFTPVVPLPQADNTPQQLFWRVLARDGEGNGSAFSSVGSFSLDAVPPIVPPDLRVDRPDPALTGDSYTSTFRWDVDPDVEHYETSLDDKPFTDIGTADTETGDLQLGVHHIFRVRAFDDFGNDSLAMLFFSDGTGDTTSFEVATGDFLPRGDHNFAVRAQDELLHQSDPGELLCRVTDLVICQLSISLVPSSAQLDPNATVDLTVRIETLGLEIDGAEISIDIVAPLVSQGIVSTGATITGIDTGDGTIIDFTANFAATTGDIDVATIRVQLPAPRQTVTVPNVRFVPDSGDRKTVGTFEGNDVPTQLLDASITYTPAPPAPGPGPGPGPAEEDPVAVIAAVSPANEGDSVAFDGSGSTDDGTIVLYEWEFGDGTSGVGATTTHVYADNGNFIVTLTVTDDDDATDIATTTASIANVAPSVDAGPDETVTISDSLTISPTFTDPGSADTHDASIDWGDGSPDTVINPAVSPLSGTHTYTGFGPFTVTVTVTDDNGGSGSDTLGVTMEGNIPPVAEAGSDQTSDEGDTVLLDSAGSNDPDGTIALFEWDFGDGTTAQGATQAHVYTDDGIFTVTLTVTDNLGGTADDTAVVTVANVAPIVQPGPDQSVDEGVTVILDPTFSDAGSDDTHVVTVNWTDGTTPTTIDPATSPASTTHEYGDNGPHIVTITVTDDDGDSGTGQLTVTVNNVAPHVDAGPDHGALVGDTVSFAGSFDDPGFDDTHTVVWDFGDGAVVVGDLTPTHVYGGAGTFTATLTVTDDDGASDADSVQVVVVPAALLPAGLQSSNLTLSNTDPQAGEPVTVSATVANISNSTITDTVVFFLNGAPEATFNISLAAGASTTLSFITVQTQSGAYIVQFGAELAVFNIAAADLVVFSLEVSPTTGGPNTVFEIVAEIRNDGDAPGTETFRVTVDASTVDHEVTLPPSGTTSIVRLVSVPAELPPFGITNAGLHNVSVNGHNDHYRVVEPVIMTDVPVQYDVDPDSTQVTDDQGNPVELVPGGQIIITGGSITLAVPVRASLGVKIASFVDTRSGISIIGKNVKLPIRSPVTGEVLARLEGVLEEELEGTGLGDGASGKFKSLNLLTDEKSLDLSDDDPRVGKLAVSLNASLDQLPQNVSLDVTIKKELTDEDKTSVELVTREEARPKIIANEAGTVSVETPGLESADISQVEITMKVGFDWVLEFGKANVRIAHVDDEGNVEILDTVCTGPDQNLQFTCVGVSQGGFSEFTLLSVVDQPTNFSARNLLVAPEAVEPGEAVTITVDVLNLGTRLDPFSTILKLSGPRDTDFRPVAVKEITLAGGQVGTIRFIVAREEQGRYQVEIEARKGEILTGVFDVFKKIDPAQLRFRDLVITPDEVVPGRLVTISMFVENTSDQDGRTEIEFRINEVLTELRSQFVPGRGSIEVLFLFTPPAEGTYVVQLIDADETVAPLRGEITAAIPLLPAEFRFAALSISPLEADPGDEVTITFELSNIGEETGVRTVILLLDGVEVDRLDVAVDALSLVPATFTITAPQEAGTYTLRIEDLTGTFRVIVREITIEEITPVPARVPAGRLISVDVDVANPHDVEATRTLTLKLDGVVIEDSLVTLGAGQTSRVTFEFTAPDIPGRHTIDIAGFEQTFEVVILAAALNLVAPLTISPTEASPDGTVTITAVLSNSGEEQGQTEIVLRINGEEVETRTVVVPGEGQRRVTFEITRAEEGDYAVEIEAVGAIDVKVLRGSFTVAAAAARLVTVPGTLKVEPLEVDSGEPVTVSLDITNEDEVAGTRTVSLFVDGVLVETQEITVGPGETGTVSFTFEEEDSGTHTVRVEQLTAEFEVTAPADGGGLIIIVIVVAIFAIIGGGIGAFLYLRKRRSPQAPAA